MKTLTLDYSKWRCGGGDTEGNKHGRGLTRLKNQQGYMCCLGQFSLQLGCNRREISDASTPEDVGHRIPLLTNKSGEHDSRFSNTAMGINDDDQTTTAVKIKQLRSLTKKYGYRLVVKNLYK